MAAVIRHISGIPVEEWRRVQVPEGWRAELIGGEFVVNPAPTWGHAVIATRLADALRAGVPASCVVSTSAVEWEIGGAILTGAPQPDLVVATPADTPRLLGPPLLAAEILSPSDRQMHTKSGMTRIEAKRQDYADGGLADYLEVDRVDGVLTVRRYELHDGELRVVDRASGDGVLTSERPFAFSIRPADLEP
jgi:Uma2 family endonuclease